MLFTVEGVTHYKRRMLMESIFCDMRTFLKKTVSLIETALTRYANSFLCHLDIIQAQIKQDKRPFYTIKQLNNLYNLCLNDKMFNFCIYIAIRL